MRVGLSYRLQYFYWRTEIKSLHPGFSFIFNIMHFHDALKERWKHEWRILKTRKSRTFPEGKADMYTNIPKCFFISTKRLFSLLSKLCFKNVLQRLCNIKECKPLVFSTSALPPFEHPPGQTILFYLIYVLTSSVFSSKPLHNSLDDTPLLQEGR